MTIRDDLPSLFAYTRWADDRIVEAMRGLTREQFAAEPSPGWTSVRATLVHVASAMHVWAARLDPQATPPSGLAPEADYATLDDAVSLLDAGHDAIARLLAAAARHDDLAAVVTYRNFKGVATSAPLWAIFRHLVNHATYHRGQLAAKLKRLGVEPPLTDLVLWANTNTPQPEE